MSRMIRTSFGTGRGADCGVDDGNNDEPQPSPTSVADLVNLEAPVVVAAKRERSFLPGRSKAKTNDSNVSANNSSNNNNNNNNDLLINQLKRQVTTLEHEKASLEQELLNQINTVVFDKETMVGTLQEKLVESESRYKEERQAHAETRTSIRQQRLSSFGEAKFEILRLQDEVQELSTTNEQLRQEIEKLGVDREKDNEQFLSQYTMMEQQFEARIKEMEQTHVLAIADLERDMFERNQLQRKDAEHQLQAETSRMRELEDRLHESKEKHKEATANNQALISNLEEANHELLSQISELSSQLLNEQTKNCDLQSLVKGSKAELDKKTNETISLLTTELADLKTNLSRTEAENLDLIELLEVHESNASSSSELEAEVASLSEKLQQAASENEHLRDSAEGQKTASVTSLREELYKSEAENETLSVTLQRQKRTVADLRDAIDDRKQQEGSEVSLLEGKCQQQSHEIESLKLQLEGEKSTNNDLNERLNSVTSLEATIQQQDAELSSLRNECARRDEELEHLWERLDVERVANDSLRDSLEAKTLEQSDLENDTDAKISMLETKCAEQQEEIDMITILLDEEKASNAAILKNLKTLEQVNSALSAAEEGSQSAVQAEKDTLTSENNELRSKLAESETSREAIEASLAEMETQNKKLCASRKQHEDLISNLQKEMDRAHVQNEDLRQQVNRMQCKSKDLLQQIDSVKSMESSLRLELDDERHANSELQMTLEDRNDAIRELEDQVQQLQEEATLVNTLEEENGRSLQEKHDSACASLDALERKLREQRRSMTTLVSTLHGEENGRVHPQAAQAETEAAKAERQHDESDLVVRLEAMVQDLDDDQETIQALQTSLEFTLSKMAEAEELSAQNKILDSKTTSLSAKADALRVCVEREQAANAELKQMLKSQESQIEEFKASQSCTEMANADFELDRVALLNRIGSLKEALEEVQSANQSLQGRFNDVQASQEQKDEKLMAQEKELILLRDKARHLRSQVQATTRELNVSKASHLGSRRANAELESEQRLIIEQLETTIASNSEMKSSLNASSAALTESEEKYDELSCELVAVRKQIDVLEGRLSSTNSQLEIEQSAKASLHASLELVRNENVEFKTMVDNLIDSLLTAEGVNADLSNQLQNMSDNMAGNKTTLGTPEEQMQGGMKSSAQESSKGASPTKNIDKESEPVDKESANRVEDQGEDDPEKKFDAYYLKNSLACLEGENMELRQALGDHLKVRNMVTQLEADKRALLGEINDLQDQLGQKLAAMSDSNQSLEEQQMESIVRATLDNQTTRDDAIVVLHKEREALQSEIAALRDQLADTHAKDQSRRRRDLGVPTNIALEKSHEHSDDETGSASLTDEEEVAASSPVHEACLCKGDIDALKRENSQLRDQLKSLQLEKCSRQNGESTSSSCGDQPSENDCRPFDEDETLQTKATDLKKDQAEETMRKLHLLESNIAEEKTLRQQVETTCHAQKETITTLEADLVKTQSAIEEEKTLRQQAEISCHSQQETITTLETELLSTQSTIQEEKALRQQAETTCHTQKETIAALETELLETQSAVESLEEHFETLHKKVNDKARKDSAKWGSHNEELKSTKAWLEKSLDEVEGLRGDLSKTTKLLQGEERNNQKLRGQIEQLESELFDTKKALEINLEEAERLQDCLTTNEEENEERRQLLESFKAAAEHWRGEADKLKNLKDKAVATQMERESKLKQAYKKEVGEYKLRVEEFEQRLLEENEKLRAEAAAVKESSGGSIEEVKHLSSQLVLLKQRLEVVESEKEALADSLKVEASTAQRNQNEISSVRQQLDSTKREEQETRQRLEAQLREAEQQVKGIKKERAALQDRLDDFEADRMEKMLMDIEEQKEIDKIKAELTVERDTVAKCKAELQKLRSTVGDLEQECAVSASQADVISSYKQEIQSLRAESEGLHRKCEEAVAQATEAQASAERAEEARKTEHARALSSQKLNSVSNQQLIEEVEDLKKELNMMQVHKIDLETRCKEKILILEQDHSLQLKEKTKEITKLRDFICDGEESTHPREDLLVEIKELREKTIVQERINHALQNRIEVLQQGREKFFEAKRKDIMRDHGEHQSLRKENTRLREQVVQVNKERRALQAQLETFSNSLGTSMTIRGIAPTKRR